MLKRTIGMITALILLFAFSSCSRADSSVGSSTQTSQQTEISSENESSDVSAFGDTDILVAYFSVPETDGVDTVAGASRVVVDGEVLGNNQYIANIISRETGGDLFRIETVQAYPATHDDLLNFAYEERSDDARPQLSSEIENPEAYDIVFLGYPNWNSDLPMPLYTFLEQNDLSGKTIVPFTVHGGSGFSGTIETIAELQPGATVIENGLSVSRNNVPDAESEVISWLEELGFNQQ